MIKPCIIVCSETRKLVHPESFNITGYKMYYNKNYINSNDGVVVYISDYIKGLHHCDSVKKREFLIIFFLYKGSK